jgi:hypothetical protein
MQQERDLRQNQIFQRKKIRKGQVLCKVIGGGLDFINARYAGQAQRLSGFKNDRCSCLCLFRFESLLFFIDHKWVVHTCWVLWKSADAYHQLLRNLPRCPAPKKRYVNDCRQRKNENKYCRAMLLGHEEVLVQALRVAKVPS